MRSSKRKIFYIISIAILVYVVIGMISTLTRYLHLRNSTVVVEPSILGAINGLYATLDYEYYREMKYSADDRVYTLIKSRDGDCWYIMAFEGASAVYEQSGGASYIVESATDEAMDGLLFREEIPGLIYAKVDRNSQETRDILQRIVEENGIAGKDTVLSVGKNINYEYTLLYRASIGYEKTYRRDLIILSVLLAVSIFLFVFASRMYATEKREIEFDEALRDDRERRKEELLEDFHAKRRHDRRNRREDEFR